MPGDFVKLLFGWLLSPKVERSPEVAYVAPPPSAWFTLQAATSTTTDLQGWLLAFDGVAHISGRAVSGLAERQ
jgi:hypothetical protein